MKPRPPGSADWQVHAQEALDLTALWCVQQAAEATARAEKAEAAVARVRAVCEEYALVLDINAAGGAISRVLRALDGERT